MRFPGAVATLLSLRTLWFAGLSFSRIYRRLLLFERSLDQAPAHIPASGSMHVTMLAANEIVAYLAFRPDQNASEIRRRLDEDHRCFAVWRKQQIVHAAWAATGRVRIEYLARELTLPSDVAYIYDAFTTSEFRGRNASPVRALAMGDHFRARGYRRFLTAARPENAAGMQVFGKTRSRRVGVIGYLGLGRLRWHFCHRHG